MIGEAVDVLVAELVLRQWADEVGGEYCEWLVDLNGRGNVLRLPLMEPDLLAARACLDVSCDVLAHRGPGGTGGLEGSEGRCGSSMTGDGSLVDTPDGLAMVWGDGGCVDDWALDNVGRWRDVEGGG